MDAIKLFLKGSRGTKPKTAFICSRRAYCDAGAVISVTCYNTM